MSKPKNKSKSPVSTDEIITTLTRLRDAIGKSGTATILTAAIVRIKTPQAAAVGANTIAEKRSAAANKAWDTRRRMAAEAATAAQASKRSAAANKAWDTRRQRAAAQVHATA